VPKLGVNIDHVATLRQARYKALGPAKTNKADCFFRLIPEPSPMWAAVEAELAGANGITIHLREDRRHIQDRDVTLLRELVRTGLNLEMANVPEIVSIALKIKPDEVCLVPEKRQEVTTEGGLDIVKNKASLKKTIQKLKRAKIRISLFIDPNAEQVRAAKEIGADIVEFHTGSYADSKTKLIQQQRLKKIAISARLAADNGLQVNAGHGLNYDNVRDILTIPELHMLNIGHSIISRSVFVGLKRAVREMIDIIS